jgi:hypothetical protein
MKDLECPECGAWNDAPDDCHEPNRHYECECSECEKVFGFQLEYYPSYTEYKTPCANGEPHNWKPVRSWPEDKQRVRCSYCEEESTVDRIAKQGAIS